MAQIARSGNEPFASGATSVAADLETDIAASYKQMNGLTDNTNIVTGADINGTKLQNGTLTATNIFAAGSGGIAPGKMATRSYVQVDATGHTMTTSTTTVDVPGLDPISVTPHTVNDVIIARFTANVNHGSGASFAWLFEVDGTDTTQLALTGVKSGFISFSYQWAFTSGQTIPIQVKPRYALGNGTGTFATTITNPDGSSTGFSFEANKIFSVIVLPG